MLWIIWRDYRPDTAEIRAANLQSHRNYMQSRESILVIAGALQNDEGTEDIGSSLVITANSRADAQAFLDGDPYTHAGIFGRTTVTRMRKGRLNFGAAEAT